MSNKMTTIVYKFLLEDVIYRYGCMAERGELNANEATKLFE